MLRKRPKPRKSLYSVGSKRVKVEVGISSLNTRKRGKRRNRLQTLQVFQCTECLHRFTGAPAKHKTYPLKIIRDSISMFNLGHSLTETQALLRKRFHRDIPDRTISSWPGGDQYCRGTTSSDRKQQMCKRLYEDLTRSKLQENATSGPVFGLAACPQWLPS